MTWQPPIRVVGCGSPQGDDAVGWRAIERLRSQMRPNVETHTVSTGWELLDILDGRGTLLLIDAVQSGQPPGTIHELRWPDPRLEQAHRGSTHGVSPAEALRLADACGLLPARVFIFAIEVGALAPLARLSSPAAASVAELTRRLENWLEHDALGLSANPVSLGTANTPLPKHSMSGGRG
ncbi:MAG: hydrogenase maturation protease [Planctomycetes bacterium]|nr:hydrogenase maturation protease [Planctomycetota bacterium]